MGRWDEINVAWYRLHLVYCDLCGRVIPRRLWVAEVGGEDKRFCDERCEELYRGYWLTEGASSGFSARAP
jgi:hypothetical protein